MNQSKAGARELNIDFSNGGKNALLEEQHPSASMVSVKARPSTKEVLAVVASIAVDQFVSVPTDRTPGDVQLGAVYLFSAYQNKAGEQCQRFLAVTDSPDSFQMNSPAAVALLRTTIDPMRQQQSLTNELVLVPNRRAYAWVGHENLTTGVFGQLIRIELPTEFTANNVIKQSARPWAALAYNQAGETTGILFTLGAQIMALPIQNLLARIKHARKTGAPSFNPLQSIQIKADDGSIKTLQAANVIVEAQEGRLFRTGGKVAYKSSGYRMNPTDTAGVTWKLNLARVFTGGKAQELGRFQAKKGMGDPIGKADQGVRLSERQAYTYIHYGNGVAEVRHLRSNSALKAGRAASIQQDQEQQAENTGTPSTPAGRGH